MSRARRAATTSSIVALGVAAGLGPTRRAAASPLEDLTEGSVVFTGPTSAHPTALFVNPAALGLAGAGWHVQVGGDVRLDQLSIDRDRIDASGAASPGASVDVATLTPGAMIAWWSQVADNGHFGVMIHTPFSERFPAGEDALGYHSLGGYLVQTMVTAGGSWRFDRLIVGATFSLSYTRMRYEFLRDTALEAGSDPGRGVGSACGDAPCGLENPAAAEHYTIATDTGDDLTGDETAIDLDNAGLGVGAALEIPSADGWWLAASIAGAFKALVTDGDAAVERAPRDGGGTLRGDARVGLRTPFSMWLGLRGPLSAGWELVTALRWQDNSRHDELDLRMRGGDLPAAEVPEWYPRYRGLRDTVQASVGLERDRAALLRLGGRLRFESAATTFERVDDRADAPERHTASPLGFDSMNLGLSLGAEWRVHQHLVLGAIYDLTGFLPTDVRPSAFDPKARIDCVDGGYRYGDCRALREGRAYPSAAGDYGRFRHIVALSLRWDSL